MLFGITEPIWFYREPVDFRSQINGLSILVADSLDKDPTSGEAFIFRNRSGNKLKILLWDNNGFWLLYKRLEKARFQFPTTGDKIWQLNRDQFVWLLSGIDITKQKTFTKITATKFY